MHTDNIIHAYTRSDAIADGLLIDASPLAKEAGFRYPLAMTRAAWETCVRVPTANTWQDETGRLWDVLVVLAFAIRNGASGEVIHFAVHVLDGENRTRRIPLKAICGPGDDAAPVLTILLPDED